LRRLLLFRALDRRNEDHPGAGLIGGAARDNKLEICAGGAQRFHLAGQSARLVGHLAGPNFYLLYGIRHGRSSFRELPL
jgi:hypothetical protein